MEVLLRLDLTTGSQRTRILMLLQEAGSQGVTNIDLNGVCFRYGARIFELRKLGHDIKTIRVRGEQEFRFVLMEKGQISLFQGAA